MKKKFPFVKQLDSSDCGPACLSMILRHYGKIYSIESIREKCFISRSGVSMLAISDTAESLGMRTSGVKISYEQLAEQVNFPLIAHWQQKHFVVVYKVKKDRVYVSDPAHGLVTYTREEFLKGWQKTGDDFGICLLLEPSPDFYKAEDESLNKASFKFLLTYIRPYKKFILQLFLGMGFGSLLQLIFPFLTQAIVDFGINNHDIGFITLILMAQLVLFLSRSSVDFIRSWILLHISTRVNIHLISDFLIKLMKLPIGFFDSKRVGDLLQRIGDHRRIESFLTTSTLNILFSLVNFLVFSLVLLIYNVIIFFIFIIGSTLYVIWVLLFMKKRRDLDFKRFSQMSDNQSNLVQMITGIQEIKLNNCEKQKRWDWERIQAKLFRVNVKSLTLSQYQQSGSAFFNQVKDILITFFVAKAVIDGQMTLGMMLAVQYIIGQLNSPIQQLIGFIQAAQDAKISLERLSEIHSKDDEEEHDRKAISILPENKDIKITNLSFRYGSRGSEMVLKNLHLTIPQNKVTAIVGVSGSGKTTLIKLLLGFYPPTDGEIRIGDLMLGNINTQVWRQNCGVVMQEGFIFSDTITNNICLSDEKPDKERMIYSVKMANIQKFVESLPYSYNTEIGMESGHGLSQGQKQRLLIARAIYKNPEYLFLDEATNALDANNEKIIINNLNEFFQKRTVIVVAHRLSTVKNADQIVLLDEGKIVELGTHTQLVKKKGHYYNLIKNQLELGK